MVRHIGMARGIEAIALALATSASCVADVPAEAFPDFEAVERIIVIGNGGRDTLGVITDSARIAAIVRFANARNSGWKRPWFGVPVPAVSVELYDIGYQGDFGAGPGFFFTQRAADFASRDAAPDDLRAFALLIGIDHRTIERSLSRR